MSCSVKSRVSRRSWASRAMRAMDSRVSPADMPAVGSSRRRISGSSASAMPSSSCFCPPCERKRDSSWARSWRPTARKVASVSSRKRRSAFANRLQPRPRCDTYAAWTFSNTVRRGKMLVRWKERPMPSRQRSCGRDAGDVAPLEDHPARVGPQVPGDEVEERGLAGAVGPDDGADRALRHREAHAAYGLEAVEALGDVADLKHGRSLRRVQRQRLSAAPARPPGNTKSSRTRMLPSTSGQYCV